jgi:LysM repeat protein
MNDRTVWEQWRTNLLITAAVIGAVLIGLTLAQVDQLLQRQPAPLATLPLAVLIGTATPELITLPTASATPSAPAPTATGAVIPEATAIALQPTCNQVPASWVRYVVQRGDTLSYLAVRSGATISELVQANCLEPNLLLAGMVIYLPAAPPVRPVCGPPSHWVRYTVQPGDTKYSLARSRNTTIYAIDQANCFRPLLAGSQIFLPPLPATATPLATATGTATPVPTATGTATATGTMTATPTLTVTATVTATATATILPTGTATATGTATSTIVATATATGTALPTITATGTPLLTATVTATPVSVTATPTPTAEPTATVTPLPTTTPTPTSQPTATVTETAVSPTPTPE